jgi:hypothetical protein
MVWEASPGAVVVLIAQDNHSWPFWSDFQFPNSSTSNTPNKGKRLTQFIERLDPRSKIPCFPRCGLA